MSTEQLQRPAFYEGQYLGAADLDAAIDYARLRDARHHLGAHVWGIAVGLQLKEEPALTGGGAVDVFLQPGYAVDGFGRPLVVTTPQQIPAELFKDEFSGRVPVWLRYVEQATGAPGYGFEVCEVEDQYRRVVEAVEVVVGDRSPAEQRDEVSVAGVSADAVEALHVLDEADPLLCDGSIPFQAFPEPGDAYWLVPLGYVRWEAGSPGRFVASDEDDRRVSRAARRYLGVVAEGIQAADRLIRLRDRATEPPAAGTSSATACDETAIRASGDIDLAYDEENDRVHPAELVWVEGHLRVVGDARLFGGKLEFRDATGADHDVPLWLRRVETNAFNEPAGPSGRDLQLLLGASDEGRNRLVVGQVSVDEDGTASVVDRVIVQDDGRIGIGTANPTSLLSVPLTIRGLGDDEDLIGFEDTAGNLRWQINQTPGGTAGLNVAETGASDSRLFLQATSDGGHAGIGTSTPTKPLTVRARGSGEELLGFEDPGGTLKWHINQNLSGSADGLNFAESGVADGRLFLQAGGNVGIGTTSPQTVLHLVGGNDATQADDAGYLLIGTVDGLNLVIDDNEIMARSNRSLSTLHLQADGGELRVHSNQSTSQQVIVTGTGEVGIGTSSPAERLDVRGNIKLGSSGNFFAVGALQNLRVIAGRVSSSGSVVTGTGYSVSSPVETAFYTEYTVDFNDPFDTLPVVLVSPVDEDHNDNHLTVHNISTTGFEVGARDVWEDGDPEETAFTFIALGLRA